MVVLGGGAVSYERGPPVTPLLKRQDMAAEGRAAPITIQEQLLYRNVQRFRGGLVFKAHRLVYHSTVGLAGHGG